MGKIRDLSGQRFGRLIATHVVGRDKCRLAVWSCVCECGNVIEIAGCRLTKGNTKSCGCYRVEYATKHNLSRHKLYGVWAAIKQRCLNQNNKNYHRYGGRGISICDEWKNNPEAFVEYISNLDNFGECGFSIDREDNDGNYEPGNIRWASRKTQAENRKNGKGCVV